MGKFLSLLNLFGLNPKKFYNTVSNLPAFYSDYRTLKAQAKQHPELFPFGKWYPCLEDKTDFSGVATGHYFHQDLLVARRIFENNPVKHVDVASRVEGFVAHVAAFREIEVFDIRELNVKVKNIRFKRADLMEKNPATTEYCDSLSCLHSIEHFGLGRYGDKLDYLGHISGIENLSRILKKGGKFYFSTPIGPQRIEFNSQRVFSVKYLLDILTTIYRVDHFSYVDDKGDLHENAPLTEANIANNFGCHYGCGIFELTKL